MERTSRQNPCRTHTLCLFLSLHSSLPQLGVYPYEPTLFDVLDSGEGSFIHIKYPTSIHVIFTNNFVQDTESNIFLAKTSSSATEAAPG